MTALICPQHYKGAAVGPAPPPEFVTFNSGSLDNVASGAVAYPSPLSAGDLLFFGWQCDGAGLQTPVGFTEGASLGGSGGSHATGWAWRIVDGTEAGSVTVATASGNERSAFVLARISGVDATNPIHASATQAGGANTTVLFADLTTSIDNCLLLQFVGAESGDAGASFASFSVGLTEVYDNLNGPPGTGSGSAGAALATVVQETAGTRSGDNCDVSGTGSTQWRSYSIAIAPEGGS